MGSLMEDKLEVDYKKFGIVIFVLVMAFGIYTKSTEETKEKIIDNSPILDYRYKDVAIPIKTYLEKSDFLLNPEGVKILGTGDMVEMKSGLWKQEVIYKAKNKLGMYVIKTNIFILDKWNVVKVEEVD